MLALIFVAILLGVGTVLAGEPGKPFAALLQSLSAVLLKVVGIVMEATPFGVFALIANAVAENGAAVFVNVGWLALAVVLGSPIQILVVHSLICVCSPGCRWGGSSAASSMRWRLPFRQRPARRLCRSRCACAEDNLGVGPGHRIHRAAAGRQHRQGRHRDVCRAAQPVCAAGVRHVPLTVTLYATVLLTGSLAAFGTAPVPSASLFMLPAVLSAAGIEPEQTALVVGFVLPFDRLLDMTRTVPSAYANLTVAATVARWEGELDDAALERKPLV